MRGYQLRFWRYGAGADQDAESALSRETWPASHWKSWQEERLAETLHRAATKVPYYREQWSKRRQKGDSASWEILDNWPILEKATLRDIPEAFVSDDFDRRQLHEETTSGTTGQPVRLWFNRDASRSWYALSEARFRRWNGVTRHDRWALLGAQLVTPVEQKRPPFWVWNRGLSQLYMSAYHLSAETARQYVEALAEHDVRYLWGHSSALEFLAREILQQRLQAPRLHVVLSSSEPLTLRQRNTIRNAFLCRVRETYGMTEIAAGASECEHGSLHLWPEVSWTELTDTQRLSSGAVSGDLVSTGFLNAAMPLIRYRIGDRAAIRTDHACTCGRSLPVVEDIEGRTSDMLFAADGRRVSPSSMEIVFDTDLAVHEAQIVQDSLQDIRVRYVPAPGFTDAMGSTVVQRVRERLGDVNVVLEPVERIPRTKNAKLRAVVCNVTLPLATASGVAKGIETLLQNQAP